MIFLYRCCTPSKNVLLFNKLIKREAQMLSYLSNCDFSEKFKTKYPERTGFHVQLNHSIHVTKVNNDIGTGLAKIGAGISGIGVGLVGLGMGNIAASTLQGISRNPSAPITGMFFVAIGMVEGLGLFILAFGAFIASG